MSDWRQRSSCLVGMFVCWRSCEYKKAMSSFTVNTKVLPCAICSSIWLFNDEGIFVSFV